MISSYGKINVKEELEESNLTQKQGNLGSESSTHGMIPIANSSQHNLHGEDLYESRNISECGWTYGQQDPPYSENMNNTQYNFNYQYQGLGINTKTENLSISSNLNQNVFNSAKGKKNDLRRGKWTTEEEAYANRLIQEFKNGLLPVPDGTTLRSYLSRLLNCDPMRISKKFVGSNCIGKQVFRRRQNDMDRLSNEDLEKVHCEIADLEKQFYERVAQTNKCKGSSPGMITGRSHFFNGGSYSMGTMPTIGSGVNSVMVPPWMLPPKTRQHSNFVDSVQNAVRKDEMLKASEEEVAALGLEMLGSGDHHPKAYSWINHEITQNNYPSEDLSRMQSETSAPLMASFVARNSSVEDFLRLVETGDVSPPKTDQLTVPWPSQKDYVEEPSPKKLKTDIPDQIDSSSIELRNVKPELVEEISTYEDKTDSADCFNDREPKHNMGPSSNASSEPE